MQLILLALLLLTSNAYADCIGMTDHVVFDLRFKKVAVWSKYTIDGKFVDYGLTRYDESSKAVPSLILKDQKDYCKALIQRQASTKSPVEITNMIAFLNGIKWEPIQINENDIPSNMSYDFAHVSK